MWYYDGRNEIVKSFCTRRSKFAYNLARFFQLFKTDNYEIPKLIRLKADPDKYPDIKGCSKSVLGLIIMILRQNEKETLQRCVAILREDDREFVGSYFDCWHFDFHDLDFDRYSAGK